MRHILKRMRQKVIFQDLGRISYAEAWERQTVLHRELIDRKVAYRKGGHAGIPSTPPAHTLLFCEHPPVYTLGKSGSMDHLLLPEAALQEQGFEFFKINRGGDITYHGPGQIVGYPIFDLEYFFTDVHRYVRSLEEAIIRTIAEYGLLGIRQEGFTGVWLEADGIRPMRKICAIGVHLSRWVTLHGFAFNVQPNLSHFGHIIPCGIQAEDKGVTSLAQEIGVVADAEEVKGKVKKHFAGVFDFDYINEPISAND